LPNTDEPGPAGRFDAPGDVVAVGRIGKAHGIRGDLFVEPWTDFPQERFGAGAELHLHSGIRPPLTVVVARDHSGKLVVHFAGVEDRSAAERLRGEVLVIPESTREPLEDPDEFYDSDLIGLAAELADGGPLGVVTEVLHIPSSSLLAVVDDAGREHLVPFRKEIVPVVDLEGGRISIWAPEGLLDL
jgi:16S rRNA processing protein RimM